MTLTMSAVRKMEKSPREVVTRYLLFGNFSSEKCTMATKDQPTILERILAQRKIDVELAKSQVSITELKNHLNDFPLVDFYERSQRDSNNRFSQFSSLLLIHLVELLLWLK